MKNYDVERFIDAQDNGFAWGVPYAAALREIRNGKKVEHWIWYVFPQLRIFAKREIAWRFGIENLEEAQAYWDHPVLRQRLIEISSALLQTESNDPVYVMGELDYKKLARCMTLFSRVRNADPVFQKVLDKFYGGKPSKRTLEAIGELPGKKPR